MAQETKILSPEIPEDLLHQLILPRLPCKPLARFKAVSKAFQAMISSDTRFPTLQSVNPSPASTGFVYVQESGLSFFPNQDAIGIPDPSLKFMVKSPEHVKLLSSANGLLLFYLFRPVNSLCVCNPATMKKEILPKEPEENICREMGLAFNPHVAPGRYAVVNPLFITCTGGMTYSFNVFRSETGEWKFSKQRVFVPRSHNAPSRPVYAKGMLYWICIDYLLWFDPENDCAGTISLPYYKNLLESARHEVEVFKDEISCMCITSKGGVEVWVLTGGTQWERLYELSIAKLIHESPENLCFGLPGHETLGRYSLRKFVSPIAFDGRNVYVSVDSKGWRQKQDLLTTPKRISFDRDSLMSVLVDDFYFSDMEIFADDDCETNFEEDLLCCDMVTGRVISTGKSMIRTNRNYQVFYYHNSMVALPPISK